MPSDPAQSSPEIVTVDQPNLPPHANETAPPIHRLFLKGNMDLLNKPAIGIVGSRRASPVRGWLMRSGLPKT